jgi:ribosomal protein S18 acetylase RimI-like enzyme
MSGDECCHPDRDGQSGQVDAELGDVTGRWPDGNHRAYSSFEPAKSACRWAKPRNRRCTGECIRGLLCHICNIAFGYIERRYAMARAYLDSPVPDSAPHARLRHDEYASAVRIEPLPERLYDAAIRLWQDSGLTRPWNDPEADLRRAAGGGSSCVLAVIGDDDSLLATAMVGHDGHRGWVYYLAVEATQRGRGLGRQMMEACEDWVRSRGIPKIQLMVRATNRSTIGFYERLGYANSEVVVLGRRLDG